ncbi:tetratricopeptide repeat protein [Blastochloris viridis]|uniref:Cellulose synthase subunit BcsC n=1 Tax=Blastochloris viridis TaxID=1079 RepID=A0A0H5BB77_BLAVI|nr:tetratricopeptide repeat protein [Blastochloris viridis]ALK10535.1 cellulose synthase subunit BcsC [Blastochloris viridis]BAR99512.1 Flp pilus assembly protein TadD [Blastochloris viridis]CUU43197.1 cellulose synthase subunit BcsC [Blastochloris viridis]
MYDGRPNSPGGFCRGSLLALTVGLGLLAGGCASTGNVTGSVAPSSDTGKGDWRQRVDSLSGRYRQNPGDPRVAVDYALALRATGQREQAVAVLQQATLRNPKDKAVAGAYGRSLADNGQFEPALEALSRAHSPDQPDWRILNVQGAVLDQMGRNADARKVYQQALTISPEEPAVLSNLGLSHMLSRELSQAEAVLRRAAEQPRTDARIRQNLALVIGLQGRFEEAERLVSKDLPPTEAQANVAYLRTMLSQPNNWQKIGAAGETSASAGKPAPRPGAAVVAAHAPASTSTH